MAQQGCKQPKWQKQPVLVDFMLLIWSIWFILKKLTPKLTHVNVPVDRRSNKCRIWRCTPELDLVFFFQLSNLMCHIPCTIRGLSTHVRRKLQNIFISENLMGQQKHSETLLPSLSWNLQVDKKLFCAAKDRKQTQEFLSVAMAPWDFDLDPRYGKDICRQAFALRIIPAQGHHRSSIVPHFSSPQELDNKNNVGP